MDLGWLRKSILSEAPAPESEAEDYQLEEDPPDDEGEGSPSGDEGGEETTPTDEGGTGDGAGDYQLDDSDESPDSDDDEGGGDSSEGEAGDPGEAGGNYQLDSGDSDADAEGDAEADDAAVEEAPDAEADEGERLRKLVLLNQYKEMSTVINGLSVSLVNLERRAEFNNDEDLEYLQAKLDDLKSKISFTVQTKFLKSDYQELLKLFYFFKFNLNDLAEFAEKLIKEANK
jgi:hypothetical protein